MKGLATGSRSVRPPCGLCEGSRPRGATPSSTRASAVFAGVTGLAVGISLYRQWGQMAVGPYALAAVV